MAKLHNLNTMEVEVTCVFTMRELRQIADLFAKEIKRNDDISSWSYEYDLYDNLRDLMNDANARMMQGSRDLESYHIPADSAKTLVAERKGAAA